jgi:hypothetical protein
MGGEKTVKRRQCEIVNKRGKSSLHSGPPSATLIFESNRPFDYDPMHLFQNDLRRAVARLKWEAKFPNYCTILQAFCEVQAFVHSCTLAFLEGARGRCRLVRFLLFGMSQRTWLGTGTSQAGYPRVHWLHASLAHRISMSHDGDAAGGPGCFVVHALGRSRMDQAVAIRHAVGRIARAQNQRISWPSLSI